MSLEEIQTKALQTYSKNMEFLSKHSPILHNKLKVYTEGLDMGIISEKFHLEFKDNKYFDIYDLENSSWIYGEDSLKYSEKITKDIDLDLTQNSFKTFYEFHYEEGVLEKIKDASIASSNLIGIAPIIDYINNNSPQKRISKQIYCYMIFGVGLGFHIPLIHKKVNSKLYCIIEPNLELFRLSLFTTAYWEITAQSRILFFISYDKELFTQKFREFHDLAYLYNHYIKFFYFSKSCEVYFEGIQSMLVSQSHNIYSYDRQLLSYIKTSNYVKKDFNFFKVNERAEFKDLNNLPLLILAGGPSLKRNIEFVKENQNKFIIMSIFSVAPFLEENGIYADIYTNYDEHYSIFADIYDQIKNKVEFNKSIFLFSSHVSTKLVSLLPKSNIYFFNAVFTVKKDIGILTGPSIGEMSYALGLILGFENIYLLGLDLAFDPNTGKSHFEGYREESQFEINREASVEKFHLRKNVLKVKGNLTNEVETTAVFYISIKQLNVFSKVFNPDKKLKVYNLSDGAYFEDVEALRIEDFNKNKLKDLEKNELSNLIKEEMNTISSNKFSIEDINFNKKILENANNLKEAIETLLSKQKFQSIEKYLIALEELDDGILNTRKYNCFDLITIAKNYCRHILPYLFYLLSLKDLNNPKNHIKNLNKLFLKQILKIIDLYVKTLEDNIKKEKEE